MTDHQQAAIEAAMKKLLPRFLGQSRTRCEDSVIKAISAAEPHLRKKWIENIKDKMPGLVDDTENAYARGVKDGIYYALLILEGAGE